MTRKCYQQIGNPDHGPAVQIQQDGVVLRVVNNDTREPAYIGFSDEQWLAMCCLCAEFMRQANN